MAKKMNLLLTLTLAVVCLAALLGAVLLPTATPAQAAGATTYKLLKYGDMLKETEPFYGVLISNYGTQTVTVGMFSNGSSTCNKVRNATVQDGQITSLTYRHTESADTTVNLDGSVVLPGSAKFKVTVENDSIYVQCQNDYSSSKDYYLTHNPWGSFQITKTKTALAVKQNGDGFYVTSSDKYVYLNSATGLNYTASESSASVFYFYKETTVEATGNTISFNKGSDTATGTMNDVAWDPAAGDYTLPECGFTYPLYKFAGWKVNGEGETLAAGATVSIAADIELVAQWEENWWNVTLKMDGQTDHVEKVEKSAVLNLGDNAKWWAGSTPAGKVFSHWTSDGTDNLTGNYTPSADVTLTAVFVDAISISFDGNGGTMSSSYVNGATAAANGTYKLPSYASSCSRTDYELVGYHCSLHDEIHALGSTCQLGTEDVTYTAQWRYEGYTLTFKVAGQEDIVKLVPKTERNWDETTTYTLDVNDPVVSGSKFNGWYLDDNTEKLWKKGDTMTTVQLRALTNRQGTFVASLSELKTYTVTLHYGSTTKELSFVEGTNNILFNQSTFTDNEMGVIDDDHTFGGWFKDSELTTQMATSYLTANDEFENLHLYAKVSAYFHVLFDWGFKANASDETNIVTDRRAVVGSQGVVALHSESGSDYHERVKYTLLGWATEQGGAVVYAADGRTNVTAPCTLYAVWDYDFFVVTIKLSGASEPVGTVEVAKNRKGNTTFKINELKDADDHLVTSWPALNSEHKDAAWTLVKEEDRRDYAVTESITLNSDVILEVRLTDHIYTLTVSWVGGTLATIKQAYNTDVTAPETDKAGYRFVAFYLNNEQGGEFTFGKMPGQDVTVWAKYEILDSTLKFATGTGATVITDVVAKTGTQVSKPADPERIGYEFVKWQIAGVDVQWLVKDGTSANPEYYINMPGGTTTMTAVWDMTEEGKTALKEQKIDELEAYAAELGVQLPDNATTGISNASTEEAILAAFDAAKAAADELKASLDEAKAAAKAEVNAAATAAGVDAPSLTAIDSATSVDAVNAAKTAALAKVAEAKASKDKVDAAKAAVAALQGKSGAELYGLIKAADTALNALSADEKAQVNLEAYNQAKAAYSAFVADVNADLEVAEKAGASMIAVSFASVAALAMLAFVLKRRMF